MASLLPGNQKSRQKNPNPFLTAKTMQEDIIEGLKIGADDYLTKPFSMEELLLLRINAIHRRSFPKEAGNSEKSFFISANTLSIMHVRF
jgi:two-component system, OmpR family, response regulator VicR